MLKQIIRDDFGREGLFAIQPNYNI